MNKEILNDIIATESFKDGDTHQAIMDIAYKEWQKHENQEYHHMLTWAAWNMGEWAKLAIMLGKYNQQVCNGGHRQYYDNGYASGSGGFFTEKDSSMKTHGEMLTLMELANFDNPIWKIVYKIAKQMERYLDSDEEESEDDLDSQYYKINEEWMIYLNEYFTKIIKDML